MNDASPMALFDISPVVVLDCLSPQEVQTLIDLFHTGQKEIGKVRPARGRLRNSDVLIPGSNLIRSSTICWLDQNENSEWIYQKISSLIFDINSRKYQFEIDTLQKIQLTEYSSAGKEFYRQHIDTCLQGEIKGQRKLSLTLQLSHPEEYKGGDLIFSGDRNDMILDARNFDANLQQRRSFGSATIFPSFLEHEITPVTEGTRHSLVAWMQGPNWK